jgi:hypothetical protein
MSSAVIKWSKKYYEELGEKDQNGFYEYAYRYFIYWFYLPDKFRIRIKNYTDEILEGSLFLFKENEPANKAEIDPTFISAILAFMHTKQGVIRFTLFDGGYKPIDLTRLKDNSKDFSFVEIVARE